MDNQNKSDDDSVQDGVFYAPWGLQKPCIIGLMMALLFFCFT